MKKSKLSIILIIYFFLLVYNPPILPKISFINILSIYSLIYIVFTYGKDTREVIINSKIYAIGALCLISFIYVILCVLINLLISSNMLDSNYIYTITAFAKQFGALFICAIYVLVKCKREKYTINDLLIMLLCVGAIQACLTVISFISPTVKSIFIEIMARNIETENIAIHVTQMSFTRVYGFAENLYDSFGYSTSILVTIALAFTLYKKFSYIYLALLLFAMPLLNSRTGIIMTGIGIIVMIIMHFFSKGNYRSLFKFAGVFITLLIIIMFLPNIIYNIAPSTAEWIQSGIEETKDLLDNQKTTGIYSILLTDSFWFFPTGLSALFGKGLEPSVLIGINSDVGYVANIWKFGIIGSLLIYYMYIKLFYYSYISCRNTITRSIILYISISFFVYMIKSNVVGFNQGAVIIFVICFKSIYDNNKELKPEI